MGEANTNLPAELSAGEIVDCTVEQIMPYGAFVRMTKTGRKGMIHISELSYSFVKNITDILNIGDKIQAKIIRTDEKGRIDLSLKQTQEPPQRQPRQGRPDRKNFSTSQGRDFSREGKDGREGRPPRDRVDTLGRPDRQNRTDHQERQDRPERQFRETRDFRAMQAAYRENNPEEADTFEKKMASFLKTSEAKITDLNTRNTARSGRPTRRRQNSKDY